ncbi:MAG: branched-chain amino acid ABC transporter permease, partial [Nanoarchaeota archaeon]
MISPYIIHLLILIGIYIILSVSLNLILGYTGLLNLGHVALFGIGAYASALLTMNGVPFVISFILAGLIAGVFGFLLVLATRKLKGDYYALANLG